MAYTDYPETDIAAHRSIARDLHLFGFVFFLLGCSGIAYSLKTGAHSQFIGLSAAVMAIGTFISEGANGMKIQALRWEVNDVHHAEDDDETDVDEQLEEEL